MTHSSAESAVNMEEFFKTVGEVRSLIEKISSQTEEMEQRRGSILSSSNQDEENKDKLEMLNNEIRKNANVVRAKLKTMQKSFPADEDSTCVSVIHRIHRNQAQKDESNHTSSCMACHSHLTRWFADVMRDHHKAQVSFRDKCKAKIQRQLEIVAKVTTDEELEAMLQRDNLTIFISDINSDTQVSSQALTEIESRHQDIISLESSIKELHEVFADMAILLEIQGELINNIEKNVTSAEEYVVKSKEETKKAVSYKNNRHKVVSLPNFLKPFRKQSSPKMTNNETPPKIKP